MSARSILTINDFIVEFKETSKLYTAALIFGVKHAGDIKYGYLINFGQLRVFKGTGDTKKKAIRNALRELEHALMDVKRYL